MSVGVESYKLEIFGANILIGIIVFFLRKRLSILFFTNTIICYWIFSFFWNSWIENHPYSSTEYSFQIENRKFVLGIDRNPDTFGIYEIISESKDSLITIGMHEKVGDSLKLTSMHENMYFHNNKLNGFSISPNAIELNKIE
ncbi:MAG: hypothetical protein AAF688_12455 [Bacteroidota bacterium]